MVQRFILLGFVMVASINISLAQTANQTDSIAGKVIELDEVIIKAMLVKHDSHSDEYRIIPELTQGTSSAYDVLSRLPGIAYNNINNSISVRMDKSVLIEVNGHRVSPEYVQSLSLDRISKIQVVYVPTARYATEGIHYVINIKLKNDYIGHDLYFGNYTMISAGGNNGSNTVSNEQPKVQYMYSGKNIDVNAGYGFADINWNYPISYSRNYNGMASTITKEVDAKNPNDHNSTNTHAANFGLNWQIEQDQTLSFRSTFQRDNVSHNSTFDVMQNKKTNNIIDKYVEQLEESSRVNEIAGALYYQGKLKNRWSIYSSLGYDRMHDQLHSEYIGKDVTYARKYKNSKDYFKSELDVNYSLNNLLALNFGYRGIWNRYMSYDTKNSDFLSKDEDKRHNAYFFFDWTPGEQFLLHAGTGVEVIHKESLEQKRNWLKCLPQLTTTWLLSDKVQFMAEYSTKIEYPSLYQVSVTPIAHDQWLIQSGNSQLLPAHLQNVSLHATFWESLIIGAEYTYTRNAITDWYERITNDIFLRTFTNARKKELVAFSAYNWKIRDGFTWSNIIQWQWQQLYAQDCLNKTYNILWRSTLEYWINPIKLLAKIEYIREMQKDPLLQGWQQYGQDLWQLSLRKNFFKENFSISINYVPPIHLGIRNNQKSCINTTFFEQSQAQNLNTYDGLLMIRMAWRFKKGRSRQRSVQQYEFEREQKIDKGLL